MLRRLRRLRREGFSVQINSAPDSLLLRLQGFHRDLSSLCAAGLMREDQIRAFLELISADSTREHLPQPAARCGSVSATHTPLSWSVSARSSARLVRSGSLDAHRRIEKEMFIRLVQIGEETIDIR